MQISHDPGPQEKSTKKSCVSFETECTCSTPTLFPDNHAMFTAFYLHADWAKETLRLGLKFFHWLNSSRIYSPSLVLVWKPSMWKVSVLNLSTTLDFTRLGKWFWIIKFIGKQCVFILFFWMMQIPQILLFSEACPVSTINWLQRLKKVQKTKSNYKNCYSSSYPKARIKIRLSLNDLQ